MSVTNSTVRYLPVVGFPGYRVGDDGSVWSRLKKVSRGYNKGTKSTLGPTWKKIRGTVNKQGYVQVGLCGPNGVKTKKVSCIVLEAFVGPRLQGMEACHFPDRDTRNNKLSNLCYGTRKENSGHAIIHGTLSKGERSHLAVLTDTLVRAIREEYATGKFSLGALSKRYRVYKSTIARIVQRRTWKHI